MPALDSNISLPPDLHVENPVPTINQIKAQIESWVVYNLQKTIKSDVHFENQLYGPWNSFLTSVFPPHRRFMIIPQALVRRAITDPDDVDEDLGNVSFGSTGAIHEARTMGEFFLMYYQGLFTYSSITFSDGREIEKKFPDFMPVKVTLHGGPIREHRVLCVVEVERNGEPSGRGHYQMVDYMEHLIDHSLREENLLGFLIIGIIVKKYELCWNEDSECELQGARTILVSKK